MEINREHKEIVTTIYTTYPGSRHNVDEFIEFLRKESKENETDMFDLIAWEDVVEVNWLETRLETDEERDKRVKREEAFIKNAEDRERARYEELKKKYEKG